MYSEELEELIEAVLADGEITEKERAVLNKRAVAEGVDPDELDVVIDGRLSKMTQAQASRVSTPSLPPPPPPPMPPQPMRSDKYGALRKCPHCGEVVEAGNVKCIACGYTFVGIDANSSVEKLSRLIQEAEEKYPANMMAEMFGMSKRLTVIPSIITGFPIPTTKEDLLEFILFLEPKTKINRGQDLYYDQKKCQAFKKKYDECIRKAKVFFADDPDFRRVLPPEKKGLFGKIFGK